MCSLSLAGDREESADWTPTCFPAGEGGEGKPAAGWARPCLCVVLEWGLGVILCGRRTHRCTRDHTLS